MSVEIVPVTDHEQYTVDGFLIWMDPLGNWTCKVDLSHKQLTAFWLYEENVIKNKSFKKNTKATFKG